ncbi:MAG: T9SS type A sorting domain-containing protein [Bacteroidota bacterium]
MLAQNEAKSKSRLTIQRTSQRVNLPILLAKRSFHVNAALQTNLDLKQNSYVAQFMKSSFAKSNSTTIVGQLPERKLVEENSNNANYLFYNDRIQVSHAYPNPASDFLDIDYQVIGNQELRLGFYNVLGEQVKEFALDRDQKSLRISLRDFSSGMYLYQLMIDGRSVATKKIIVRKGM